MPLMHYVKHNVNKFSLMITKSVFVKRQIMEIVRQRVPGCWVCSRNAQRPNLVRRCRGTLSWWWLAEQRRWRLAHLQRILVPSLVRIWLVTVCVQCAKSDFVFVSLSLFCDFMCFCSRTLHCQVVQSWSFTRMRLTYDTSPWQFILCTDASVSLHDGKLFQFVPIPNALYSHQHSMYIPIRFFFRF